MQRFERRLDGALSQQTVGSLQLGTRGQRPGKARVWCHRQRHFYQALGEPSVTKPRAAEFLLDIAKERRRCLGRAKCSACSAKYRKHSRPIPRATPQDRCGAPTDSSRRAFAIGDQSYQGR